MSEAIDGLAATRHEVDSEDGYRQKVLLRNVRHEFRKPGGIHRVLDNVSITIGEGEFVALVGRSGSGKTTILSLLAGLLVPTSGHISLFGTAPKSFRRSIGYMLARDALFDWRTARQNVELGLEAGGVPRAERRPRAVAALRDVGLEEWADRYPQQLSHGMRQRVAIARTLVMRPRLLLMDEPFAALDAQTRESVRAEFLQVWEEHRTSVCFVTHDLGEALTLADRVIVLANGRIVLNIDVPFPRPRHQESIELSEGYRDLMIQLRAAIL